MKPKVNPAYCGFTLVETLVVLAIAGILAAIAYPSFLAQLQKSRRADAMQALGLLQQSQERFRALNPIYGASLAEIGIASPISAGGLYRLSLSGKSSSTDYQASATGIRSQAEDLACQSLIISVSQGTATLEPAACWGR